MLGSFYNLPTMTLLNGYEHCVTTDNIAGIICGIAPVRCSADFPSDLWLLA